MRCAKQGLIAASFCTVVMFSADLDAVPLSCHPLCQPEGEEESPAAFKWTRENVCECRRMNVSQSQWVYAGPSDTHAPPP